MRTFNLVRKEDVSGVSGTGVVAEGVEFHDGQVVMSWFGRHHTIEVAPNISDIEAIHGHEGRTVIEWLSNGDLGCSGCGSPIELYQSFKAYCCGEEGPNG